MIFRHDKNPCPSCGANLDASSAVDSKPRPPEPGDFSICAYCGDILVYDAQTRLRSAELNDLLTIPEDVRDGIYAAQKIIHERRKHR